ncbi:MAG: hypothetical protein ACFB2Z_02380 [Maricaulaceae bacterium]
MGGVARRVGLALASAAGMGLGGCVIHVKEGPQATEVRAFPHWIAREAARDQCVDVAEVDTSQRLARVIIPNDAEHNCEREETG